MCFIIYEVHDYKLHNWLHAQLWSMSEMESVNTNEIHPHSVPR